MPAPVVHKALRLVLGIGLVALALGCSPTTDEPIPTPPNVILVSIDTLRAGRLGAYGYERDTSPILDSLATEGVRVDQAAVATHGTTQSQASMLTSVPQEVHGVGLTGRTDGAVPSSLPNLPEAFRDSGYRSAQVAAGGEK